MNPEMEIGTDEKALHINLDSAKYGTFAEIGAGQEVARRFFRVGGAGGTIAKTMSAYDMTFSDAIYGPADRYVSRVRLQTMLDHEYNLLIERLDQKFGAEKTFFVFADTVAARAVTFRSAPKNPTSPWSARGSPVVMVAWLPKGVVSRTAADRPFTGPPPAGSLVSEPPPGKLAATLVGPS